MDNIAILVVIAVILALAIAYIVRAKKKGVKCVGCPYAEGCSKGCGCNGKK